MKYVTCVQYSVISFPKYVFVLCIWTINLKLWYPARGTNKIHVKCNMLAYRIYRISRSLNQFSKIIFSVFFEMSCLYFDGKLRGLQVEIFYDRQAKSQITDPIFKLSLMGMILPTKQNVSV